jgi:hypothetical protein
MEVSYWFFSPSLDESDKPLAEGDRRSMYAARELCAEDGTRCALLFVDQVEGVPNDEDIIARLDTWADECMEWVNRCTAAGIPPESWELGPREFLIFHEEHPGTGIGYGHEMLLDREELQPIIRMLLYVLVEHWEGWRRLSSHMNALSRTDVVGEA